MLFYAKIGINFERNMFLPKKMFVFHELCLYHSSPETESNIKKTLTINVP